MEVQQGKYFISKGGCLCNITEWMLHAKVKLCPITPKMFNPKTNKKINEQDENKRESRMWCLSFKDLKLSTGSNKDFGSVIFGH